MGIIKVGKQRSTILSMSIFSVWSFLLKHRAVWQCFGGHLLHSYYNYACTRKFFSLKNACVAMRTCDH